MITFTHVSKRFGRFVALDDLNLSVAPHQAVALWGPNGAGKTTAIKCLLGLLRYDGHIDVDGLDAQKQGRSVRGRLGYVPQELAFYDDLSTLETAHFYARLKRAPEKRIVELLELVELSDHGDKAVGALSGGMKQRLALALALLADPPILVLDEPTSNLDAGARDDFLHLLKRVKAAGKTVIFTSHRLEEVEMLADEVLVLAAGKVEHRCTPDAAAANRGPAPANQATDSSPGAGRCDRDFDRQGLSGPSQRHGSARRRRAGSQGRPHPCFE